MPRQKSEITGNVINTGIRLTPAQHSEYKRLGGAAWLRKLLAQSIEQRRKETP